ncbi:hypothetical protein [Mariniflexile sp. AS56]|nr:hypothetical protein [Mariniflexile sp. AS56]MDO7173863.1 hypothetical protein [Mariniflexile sp. AS56]
MRNFFRLMAIIAIGLCTLNSCTPEDLHKQSVDPVSTNGEDARHKETPE